MRAYIGIDLGTTGARSIVYNEVFSVLGESYQEYPLLYPGDGRVEQDANHWWELTVATMRQALSYSGVVSGDVRALAVSSQGISVVPVDSQLSPLAPAISWLDQRAQTELREILRRYDCEMIYRLTGKRASAAYTLPKLLWMRKSMPDVYNAARYLLLPHDFLLAKLTGNAISDHTLAAGTMLYDLQATEWSRELCDAFQIDTTRLPALRWGGEIAGYLCDEAADLLGIPAGTTVAVGGQDQKCASLATGLREGIATISMGTAAAIEMLGACGTGEHIPRFGYFSPGTLVSEGVVNTAGLALRWLRDSLFPGHSYRELDELAEACLGNGDTLFFPFLSGEGSPGWRPGAQAAFSGLSLQSAPGDMVCAVMEGVAFELYRNLLEMGAKAGTELRIFGGGAKSPLWCRIIASSCGMPVCSMSTPEMACLGAAMLAAQGCGDRAVGAPTPAAVARRYLPDPVLAAHYREKFTRYMHQYTAMNQKETML